LSGREQLSGSEVAGRLEGGLILGPGVLTGVQPATEDRGKEPEVDWVSSQTEDWEDSSPRDIQGDPGSRDSTEGIEKEAPLIPSNEPSPFCFIAFLCSVVLKCRLRCPELVNHLSQASH